MRYNAEGFRKSSKINTPQEGGILFNAHAVRGTLYSARALRYKCLGGYFNILTLK
jgi:hypothetical protein